MADCADTGSESSRVFDYTMLFDDVVGEILVKLDRAKRCEVVDELVDALDMAMLMDVRTKVFRFAKSKLVESIAVPENMDLEPGYKRTLGDDTLRDAERMVGEWDLIARKGKPRVAQDAVELLSYVSGNDPYFPHKLIKKRPKKAIAKEKLSKSATVKQARIPFKPVSDKDTDKGDTSDSTESSSSDEDEEVGDDVTESTEAQVDNNCLNVNDESTPTECPIENSNKDQNSKVLSSEVAVADEISIETPADVTETPKTSQVNDLDPSVAKDSVPNVPKVPAKSTPVTYVDWSEIVDLFDDANDDGAHSVPKMTKPNSYANLGISKIVTIDIPCTHAKHAQSPKITQSVSTAQEKHVPYVNTPVNSKKSTTMTTQTEWDMWGTPLASVNCPILKVPACKCEQDSRLFKEWKDDVERDRVSRDEQNRAKFNYLREQKMKADEERERMRCSMRAMSKKMAENSANIAELMRRTSGVVFDGGSRASEQIAFQGWDSIESCPIDPFSPIIQPIVSSHTSRNGKPTASSSNYRTNDIRDLGICEQSIDLTKASHDDTISQMVPNPTRMIPNRDSRQASTSNGRNPITQRDSQGSAPTGNKNNSGNSSALNKKSNNPVARKPVYTPQPQRSIIVKSSGAGSVSREASRNSNQRAASSQRKDNWNDDPVSDAEMITMAEATVTDNGVSSSTVPPRSADQSRSDILREALVDAQLKDMRQKQQVKESIGNTRYDNSGKRGREDSSGSDSASGSRGTYAETAGKDIDDWNVVANSKNKKKPRFDEIELKGVKTDPHKEIFVLQLDFSQCKKTEQLEGLVKRYCKRREVDVLYAKAFQTQSDPNKANCKISVNVADTKRVLSNNFWPEHASARYWYTNNGNQQHRNDKSSDDEYMSDQ